MDIEKFLREAAGFEASMEALYREAAARSSWEGSRRFFRYMERDERSHAAYLEAKAAQLKLSGAVSPDWELAGALDGGRIAEARRAGRSLAGADFGGLLESLEKALAAEEKAAAFYRSLAASVSDGSGSGGPGAAEAARIFERFLAIEEGHVQIVRAELDLASGSGFWFDLKEFDQED